MLGVEKYIGDLLHSGNDNSKSDSDKLRDVKYGLLNVLYWGNYTNEYLRNKSIKDFKYFVDDTAIFDFIKWINTSANIISTYPNTESKITTISRFKIPWFKSGISFVSKLLMFIDPEGNYPTLDSRIATHYANRPVLPHLYRLEIRNDTHIPIRNRNGTINTHNIDAYEDWASWCPYGYV